LRKTTDQSEFPLNFGRRPYLDSYPGIFKGFFKLQDRTFSSMWLLSLEKSIGCSWKFYRRCYFWTTWEIRSNYWKSSRSWCVWMRFGGCLHSPSALVLLFHYFSLLSSLEFRSTHTQCHAPAALTVSTGSDRLVTLIT